MITFQEAKENPELRQAYLDTIDLGFEVSKIQYMEEETAEPADFFIGLGTKVAMVSHNDGSALTCQGMPGITSTIEVYSASFDWFVGETEENFLSALDHERRHATQTYKFPREFFPQLETLLSEDLTDRAKKGYTDRIIMASEIDAYRHQLSFIRSGLRRVTKDMEQCTIENLEYIASILE